MRRFLKTVLLTMSLGCGDSTEDGSEEAGPSPTEVEGIFREVAEPAGVRFTVTNGKSDAHHLIETMMGGVGWIDIDGDGFFDLYLPNGHDSSKTGWHEGRQTDRLYRNRGDGTFEDVTEWSGIEERRYSNGVAVADYDNDGDSDLLVTNVGRNTLYRNRGDGRFEDVTEQAGLSSLGLHASAVWSDLDLDGDLDLYVVRYLEFRPELARRCREGNRPVYCHPRFFDGAPDVLYENLGNGTFADISEAAGVAKGGPKSGKGLGVIATDVNGDRRPDIYVANDTTANFLWMNLGAGTFEDRAMVAGVALGREGKAQASMGIDWGDVDGDGDFDIHVTNFSNEMNNLFLYEADGRFDEGIHQAKLDASFRSLGFGTILADFDLDGDIDIVTLNGHVDDSVEESAAGAGVGYRQPPDFFESDGSGKFRHRNDRAGAPFGESYVGRGLASCDFDNDGDLDLALARLDGPVLLLENTTRQRPDAPHFLRIRLRGTRGNRDAYGARIIVTVGPTTRIFEYQSGRSYLAACDPRPTIGLGSATRVDRLEVRWPSGGVSSLDDVEADREIELVEPSP